MKGQGFRGAMFGRCTSRAWHSPAKIGHCLFAFLLDYAPKKPPGVCAFDLAVMIAAMAVARKVQLANQLGL